MVGKLHFFGNSIIIEIMAIILSLNFNLDDLCKLFRVIKVRFKFKNSFTKFISVG